MIQDTVAYLDKLIVGYHYVKSVQIRSVFWSVFSPNAGKYGPGKTPYLDTFHAAIVLKYSYFSRSYLLLTLSEKFHTKKNFAFQAK